MQSLFYPHVAKHELILRNYSVVKPFQIWMAHKISHTWRYMLGQVSSGQTQQTSWVFMDGYTWQHICIYFHTCYINNLFLDVACTSSPNEAVQYPTKRNNLFDHCSQVSWNTAMVFAVATLAATLKSWDAQCIHHFTLSKHSHIMMLFPKTSGTGKKDQKGAEGSKVCRFPLPSVRSSKHVETLPSPCLSLFQPSTPPISR